MKRITHTQRTLQKKYYTNTSHSHLIIQPHPSPTHLGPAGQLQLHRYMGSRTLHKQRPYICQKGRKKRQTYIFAAKTNFIRRSKNSATHDKQPYGGGLLSKTIMQHHFLHWEQKEKHKRLKAATQRTNPAWSSCYDGFQLSAAATGKWTQKWRKKGTDTISSMQMSSPFAVL